MTFLVIGVLGALSVNNIVAEDTDVPAVSEVSMFSAPASGDTYQFGDPIEVRVDFDRLVAITGTPQVNLTVGSNGSNTRAVGLTGPAVHFRSRTSSLFFKYTVAAADSDADGISVAADAISLNGGSIKAAADGTTDANLAHTALSPGSDHKVDGSKNEVPVVSSVSFVGSPAGGETYELGETIELKVEFHRFLGSSTIRAGCRWS